ncbi:hypothetical protein L7F22_057050, partial [Adiantum nelumboides]|nr:hypothetical protein [Adiantum nelumboides]
MIDSTLATSYELVNTKSCIFVSDSDIGNDSKDNFKSLVRQNTSSPSLAVKKGAKEVADLNENNDDGGISK